MRADELGQPVVKVLESLVSFDKLVAFFFCQNTNLAKIAGQFGLVLSGFPGNSDHQRSLQVNHFVASIACNYLVARGLVQGRYLLDINHLVVCYFLRFLLGKFVQE